MHLLELALFLLLLESQVAEYFQPFLITHFVVEMLQTVELANFGFISFDDAFFDAVYFGEFSFLVVEVDTEVGAPHCLSTAVF